MGIYYEEDTLVKTPLTGDTPQPNSEYLKTRYDKFGEVLEKMDVDKAGWNSTLALVADEYGLQLINADHGLRAGWELADTPSYTGRTMRVINREQAEKLFEGSKYGTFEEICIAMWDDRVDLSKSDKPQKGMHAYTPFGCTLKDVIDEHVDVHSTTFETIAAMHRPEKDVDSKGISLFLNFKDFQRERRTTMKPGRAIKHMFKDFEGPTVAAVAERFIEMISPRDFTLKVGDTPQDFHRAYTGKTVEFRNPGCTGFRKSLATSCMQGVEVYNGEGYLSPTFIHASGDFEIAWLEDTKGRIASRVIYSKAKDSCGSFHAPLYGSCEQSLDELQTHLDSINSKPDGGSNWEGLKLLHSSENYGRVIGPYIDMGYEGDATADGFIRLGHCGEFTFENTDGYCDGGSYCDCCDNNFPDHELRSTPSGYAQYCTECWDEHFIVTYDGDEIEQEYAVFARYHVRGFTTSDWFHTDDTVFVDKLGESWREADCTFVDGIDEWYPTHRLSEIEEESLEEDGEEAA